MPLAVFFFKMACQGLLTDCELGQTKQSKEHENELSDIPMLGLGNKPAKVRSCRSGPFENRFENAIKVEPVFEELGLKTKQNES